MWGGRELWQSVNWSGSLYPWTCVFICVFMAVGVFQRWMWGWTWAACWGTSFCVPGEGIRGVRLRRDTVAQVQLVCILLNLLPVYSWVHSHSFEGVSNLRWGVFCFTWYQYRCRENNGGLLLLIIFWRWGGLWTSEQGVLLFCMVSVAQAVRNFNMTFCATAWALSGTNFVPGLSCINSGHFAPLRLDLGQVSCCLLLSTGLLRD